MNFRHTVRELGADIMGCGAPLTQRLEALELLEGLIVDYERGYSARAGRIRAYLTMLNASPYPEFRAAAIGCAGPLRADLTGLARQVVVELFGEADLPKCA